MILSPLEQFIIYKLIDIELLGYDFSLTNETIYQLIVLTIITVLILSTIRELFYIPENWQIMLEQIYLFVLSLIKENCGYPGEKYLNFILSLFIYILVCNLVGMIPFSFTVTSHIAITLTLSLTIWIGVTIIGFVEHKLGFVMLFVPSGAPVAILPFLVVLEVLSYIIRIVSLAVRLFANMMAGHTLLKIMAGFSFKLHNLGGLLGNILFFIPLIMLFIITGLEIGIACLQAYVFVILSIIFLNDSLHLH